MSSTLRGATAASSSLLRRSRPLLVLAIASGLTVATLASLAGTIRVGR